MAYSLMVYWPTTKETIDAANLYSEYLQGG
jgi:hypothetical protein